MSDKAERGKLHARRMFAWQDQVAQDRGLARQAVALSVVAIIRSRVDSSTGVAEIEQRWLANKVGCSRKGLQKALNKLREQEHLEWQCRKGLRLPNIYRPVVRDMRTGVRMSSTSELGDAVDANPSALNVRTVVRTDSSLNSSSDPRAPRSAPAEARAGAAKRGTYELEIAKRLGTEGTAIVYERMPQDVVGELCRQQAAGALSQETLLAAALRYRASLQKSVEQPSVRRDLSPATASSAIAIPRSAADPRVRPRKQPADGRPTAPPRTCWVGNVLYAEFCVGKKRVYRSLFTADIAVAAVAVSVMYEKAVADVFFGGIGQPGPRDARPPTTAAKKPKPPPGCYWVRGVLWTQKPIRGCCRQRSLRTAIPEIAIARRLYVHDQLLKEFGPAGRLGPRRSRRRAADV